MKKIIYKIFIGLIAILLIIVVYLSTIGVKTDKFNSKIISQIKKIEPNIELRLNDVSVTLDLFDFGLNTKTIGPNLIYRDKIIKIETIKSNISIKSFIKNKFALTGISISTKSVAIKDLISFTRLFNNDPKLFILEQFIDNGYLVANLKLEFDELGNIKSNYKLNGLVRDGKINIIKRYDLNKINLIFEINEKNFKFRDINLLLNNKNILIPELIALKQNKEYLISGKLNNQKTSLIKNEIKDLINNDLLGLDIHEIIFSSKNNFKFIINKKFKVKNLDIESNIDLGNLKLKNSLELKNIFPKIKKDIIFKNQKIKLKYKKNNLNIDGEGEVLIQNKIDKIKYEISTIKNEVKHNIIYVIKNNPFELDLINYKKNIDSDLQLNIQVRRNIKKKIKFFDLSLKEENNFINIKNLTLSNDNKINDVSNINLKYTDKENLINNIEIIRKGNDYLISGRSFNINSIIEKLLNSASDKKTNFFNKNLKLIFDIKKIFLDQNNIINNLKGFLYLEKNEISELNLESKFENQKKIKFTIKKNGGEKVTTLYSHKAKISANIKTSLMKVFI